MTAAECRVIRPGTLGYQKCQKPQGHVGDHKSQDGIDWADGELDEHGNPVDEIPEWPTHAARLLKITEPDASITRIQETRRIRAEVEAARGGIVGTVTVTESYEDPELAYDVTVTTFGNGERHIRIEFGVEDTWMQAAVSAADWSKLITTPTPEGV